MDTWCRVSTHTSTPSSICVPCLPPVCLQSSFSLHKVKQVYWLLHAKLLFLRMCKGKAKKVLNINERLYRPMWHIHTPKSVSNFERPFIMRRNREKKWNRFSGFLQDYCFSYTPFHLQRLTFKHRSILFYFTVWVLVIGIKERLSSFQQFPALLSTPFYSV